METIYIADYLESLAAKVRAGTHTVELEKTEYYRAVIQEVHNDEIFEVQGDVDDSMFRETFKISKVRFGVLS